MTQLRFLWTETSSMGGVAVVNTAVGLGWPQELAGIGLVLVPFGPVSMPWEVCRLGTNELGFRRGPTCKQ